MCVCVWLCWAMFGIGDHRTLIVAQDQVRACTGVYLCVCVALLGYVWHGDHPTLIVAKYQVRTCTSVCVCVALLGYVWHSDHRTLIVAQDQVCACTSVYVCVRCWAVFDMSSSTPCY